MKIMATRSAGWILGAALLIGMPLLGVRLADKPVAPYLEMPPRTDFVEHAPFSWPVFAGMALGLLLILTPFLRRMIALRSPAEKPHVPPARSFPKWGWLGLSLGLATWVLAWTRFAWFRTFQPFTFTPLWLAYIVVMNALVFQRTGRSPLTHRTGPCLSLFPLSALFWWFFEYLNRFVQNWHYIGIGPMSAEAYILRATLPFATVLPAFVATRAWLISFPGLWSGLTRWTAWSTALPRLPAVSALIAAALGLLGIGRWHEILFPLLWIAPGLVIAALRALDGRSTLFSDVSSGDWRRIVQAALAALLCGFFWEMWNILSLEKWIYTVPFVDRFRIFEMPLLGYAGYLPFGLECALIAEFAGFDGKENTDV